MSTLQKRLDVLEQHTPTTPSVYNWREGKSAEYIAEVERLAAEFTVAETTSDEKKIDTLLQEIGVTREGWARIRRNAWGAV